jgi:hypothetical protein
MPNTPSELHFIYIYLILLLIVVKAWMLEHCLLTKQGLSSKFPSLLGAESGQEQGRADWRDEYVHSRSDSRKVRQCSCMAVIHEATLYHLCIVTFYSRMVTR